MAQSPGHVNPEMESCIRECLDCARICRQTMAHCLTKGGKHAEASHILTLQDCAESCEMSAAMMLRGSPFHAQHCAMCGEVCKACEESCEAFAGDAAMKACEDACRRCAESCRRMGAAAGKASGKESSATLHA
jgi:hypothetical protein